MRKDFLWYAREMLRWKIEFIPNSPHQELVPFVGLLRPLSVTNWSWVNAWPDEDFRI